MASWARRTRAANTLVSGVAERYEFDRAMGPALRMMSSSDVPTGSGASGDDPSPDPLPSPEPFATSAAPLTGQPRCPAGSKMIAARGRSGEAARAGILIGSAAEAGGRARRTTGTGTDDRGWRRRQMTAATRSTALAASRTRAIAAAGSRPCEGGLNSTRGWVTSLVTNVGARAAFFVFAGVVVVTTVAVGAGVIVDTGAAVSTATVVAVTWDDGAAVVRAGAVVVGRCARRCVVGGRVVGSGVADGGGGDAVVAGWRGGGAVVGGCGGAAVVAGWRGGGAVVGGCAVGACVVTGACVVGVASVVLEGHGTLGFGVSAPGAQGVDGGTRPVSVSSKASTDASSAASILVTVTAS